MIGRFEGRWMVRRRGLWRPAWGWRRSRTVVWGGHPERDFWLALPDRWWARQMLEDLPRLIAYERAAFCMTSPRSFVSVTGLTS